MKRYLSLVLVLIMITSAVLSCGSDQDTKDTTSNDSTTSTDLTPEETTNPPITDGLPETSMDGFELKIKHDDGTWLLWALTDLDIENDTGNRLDSAIFNRNIRIEERFNCTISVDGKADIQPDEIKQEVMSGDSNYDVWLLYDLRVLSAIQYLLTWEDMPYVRLDKEWWNPLATEVFNIGENTYAACGNYSLAVLSRATGFVFNKDTFQALNKDTDIYSLAKDGKWTIDKLYEFSKNAYLDINGNGDMDEDDRYGLSGSWKETFSRLLLGSELKYVTKDDNGHPEIKLSKDEVAIDKILHIYDLFTQKEIYYNSGKVMDTTGDGLTEDFFGSGKLLFYTADFFSLERMRGFDIDIGFLPCPKYNENQGRYYAPSFGAEISVLPKTLPESRRENVGILLEALAFDSNHNVIPEYKEVLLKTKLARDNESADMIDIIVDSVSFEFGLNAWQNSVANPIIRNIFLAHNNNVVSTLIKIESTVENEIKDLMEKIG